MSESPSPLPRLVPQSPERVRWEDAVAEAICAREEMARSDAQAVMEGQPRALERAWAQRTAPERAARRVVDAATPGRGMAM